VNALAQPALDALPLRRSHDARDEIEGEDPLGPGRIRVDVKCDPHLQQQAVGSMLVAQQLAVGEAFDGIDEKLSLGTREAAWFKKFVVESGGIVCRESHLDWPKSSI
jgi:hypothetical protein